MLKRLFDVILSAGALVVFSPVLLTVAALVKVTSPGPVFYRGQRVGRHGKPFRIFKFRSMHVNADRIGPSSTSGDDPRITVMGRVIRKYKLDELSQLLNVVLGDMSFVGPRPEVQKFVDLYTSEERIILELRPGITDWASIWNSDEASVLDGAPDADEAYFELIRPTKLQLQLLYARQNSLWTDSKILCHTLIKLTNKSWLPPEIAAYGRPMTWRERQLQLSPQGKSRAA